MKQLVAHVDCRLEHHASPPETELKVDVGPDAQVCFARLGGQLYQLQKQLEQLRLRTCFVKVSISVYASQIVLEDLPDSAGKSAHG